MSEFHALVPAAGFGARMGIELPKQYLDLAGQPMIWYAISTLCAIPISKPYSWCWHRTMNILRATTGHIARASWSRCIAAAKTRAESVANGLLASELEPDDWVLVHDAARPCLTPTSAGAHDRELRDDPVGGILAVPVADTLKRADAQQRIAHTEPREGLWQAQTPQMFRAGLLAEALARSNTVTDEASAIEALGLQPKLVASDTSNFKVTYPQDIELAELLLQQGK